MITATELLSGAVRVVDYRCSAGPVERPYTELHECHSISYVRKGSFGYRVRGATYELVAGSVLVGHPGDEFMSSQWTPHPPIDPQALTRYDHTGDTPWPRSTRK